MQDTIELKSHDAHSSVLRSNLYCQFKGRIRIRAGDHRQVLMKEEFYQYLDKIFIFRVSHLITEVESTSFANEYACLILKSTDSSLLPETFVSLPESCVEILEIYQ